MDFAKTITSKNKKGIPTRAIYESLSISQQRLNLWKNKDYISPTIREGKRGKTALWNIYDLLEIKTITALREEGLSMKRVVKVIEWLRDNEYVLDSTNLATDGENLFVDLSEDTIELLKETGRWALLDWKAILKQCRYLLKTEGVEVRENSTTKAEK